MGPTSPIIKSAIDKVNFLLAKDGGRVTVLEQQGDTLVVRYEAGASKDCPTCVLTEESVVMLLMESLQLQAPGIKNIELAP